jgi:hypothetical protein
MVRQDDVADWVALGDLWRRWTYMVELFATRNRKRARIGAEEYHDLHTRLVHACRRLLENEDEVQREFLTRIENLARPWVTFEALEHEEPAILADLLHRCQQVQETLQGRREFAKAVRQAILWSLVIAAAAGLVVLYQAGWDAWWMTLTVSIRAKALLLRGWRILTGSRFYLFLAVIAVVVVVVGIRLVATASRRY